MVALTGTTAQVLLGNVTDDVEDLEVLIAKSICDLELYGAPTLPTPTGGVGTYSWALSNEQYSAVVSVLKENYATIYKAGSISNGSSEQISMGSLSHSQSQSASSTSSSGGSRVMEVAAACARRLLGYHFQRC